jgi:hypothetical protein
MTRLRSRGELLRDLRGAVGGDPFLVRSALIDATDLLSREQLEELVARAVDREKADQDVARQNVDRPAAKLAAERYDTPSRLG